MRTGFTCDVSISLAMCNPPPHCAGCCCVCVLNENTRDNDQLSITRRPPISTPTFALSPFHSLSQHPQTKNITNPCSQICSHLNRSGIAAGGVAMLQNSAASRNGKQATAARNQSPGGGGGSGGAGWSGGGSGSGLIH